MIPFQDNSGGKALAGTEETVRTEEAEGGHQLDLARLDSIQDNPRMIHSPIEEREYLGG